PGHAVRQRAWRQPEFADRRRPADSERKLTAERRLHPVQQLPGAQSAHPVGMSSPPRRERGQSMVEFALVAMVAFVVLFGIIDFSLLFAGKITSTNAARNAVRFAATHPTAWSSSASPPPDTIQGRLLSAAIPAVIVNDDA